MSLKCYLLTSGSYSDYGVVAVFSTKQAAEAVLARHPGSQTQIEEYDLDPGVLHAPNHLYRWHVEMDRETGHCKTPPYEGYPEVDDLSTIVEESKRPPHSSEASYASWPPYERWTPTIKVACWARDADHALKIASEQRFILLASLEQAEQAGRDQ